MRPWPNRAFLVALAFLAGTAVPATAQDRSLSLSDLGTVANLSAPRVSPDGGTVALVVSRPNYEENRYDGSIVLVDVTTREERVFTYDRPAARSPAWSPSGDRIAFIDQTDEGAQVFVLPLGGGDARQVTHAEGGVLGFAWSPGGEELALLIEDRPEERSGVERHNKSFVVGDDHYLSQAASQPRHLWVVDIEDGTLERLTSGRAGVAKDLGAAFAWASEEWLVFTGQPDPSGGLFDRHTVVAVSRRSGTIRTLMAEPEGFGVPFISPDGSTVAVSRPLEGGPFFNPHGIWLLPLSGGEGRLASGAIDRTFYDGDWTRGGDALVLTAADRTRSSMWIQPLNGDPAPVDLGDLHPGSVDTGPGGSMAIVGTRPDRAAELYWVSAPGSPPQRLTEYNEAVSSLARGMVETVRWETHDGHQADGVLTYPPDFDPERRYPLVLYIHGGPMGASTEGFSVFPQLLAARGWLVFSPNYRGSSNLGGAYQRAVVGDAGEGPGRDVMAGVEAVKSRGIVDEDRVGVSGWSYGGYMTTWLIGHYDDWTAAVAGAAVTDYRDQYSLSDMNASFAPAFPETPWTEDGADMWEEQSPITYARDMKTPTLILSNTGDLRVPITESYKLYHALKDNGVEVRFVAYPIPGHFAQDPIHVRDVYRRWIEWFATHFAAVPNAG